MSQMICPKGSEGKCVGGAYPGEPCKAALPHEPNKACDGSIVGVCPPCIPDVPVAQSGTPTPRTDEKTFDIVPVDSRHYSTSYEPSGKGRFVLADDMRLLETELAAMRQDRDAQIEQRTFVARELGKELAASQSARKELAGALKMALEWW